MLDKPDEVLPRFVELAMQMTGGVSAGLSLFEENPAPGIFRWRYLQGSLSRFESATTPRNFSPCGITLDQDTPVLSRHPERFYNWISDAGIVVPEVLLVPLHLGTVEPLGTLWIVSEREGHFDSGHARVATELASFVGIALRVLKTENQLQAALEEQQTLAKEMSHRVKNLFMIAQALVYTTARSADTKEEMTETLMGRFHALASAHGLVRRGFIFGEENENVRDLDELLRAIVRPHEHRSPVQSRFRFAGPSVGLGEHALNGVALIFHELTTNAAKYGALVDECGRIDMEWTRSEKGNLEFVWSEYGGPRIVRQPEAAGFGSMLLRVTVERQFGGQLDHDWSAEGLRVRISLPLAALTR
jgi:two-component sensor histidine kinase